MKILDIIQIMAGGKETIFTDRGAVWIDELSSVFGEPKLAYQPSSGTSAIAQSNETSTLEAAVYEWKYKGMEYGLSIFRYPQHSSDFQVAYFFRQRDNEGNIYIDGPGYSIVNRIEVDKDKGIAYFHDSDIVMEVSKAYPGVGGEPF